MAGLLATEFRGPVARLILDSPRNRNALSSELLRELAAGIERAESDPAIRVILISHRGSVFCAGADLREQTDPEPGRAPGAGVGALVPIFQSLLDSPKPVVCQVAGPARAGGVGLITACDIAIAGPRANFATGEVRIGVAPAVLSVVTLPKIGRTAAARLFLTGATIDAHEALRIGLISELTEEGELEARVEATIDDLLLGHPGALASSKRLLQEVPGLPRDEAFARMSELSSQLFQSPGAQEGMRAFLEHRRPDWVPDSGA